MTFKAALAALALAATFTQMMLAMYDLGMKLERGRMDGRGPTRARAVAEVLSWTALSTVAAGVLVTELD